MTCAHCERELAGVATIFPEKPPVCGRADCLGWARDLALPRAPQRAVTSFGFARPG